MNNEDFSLEIIVFIVNYGHARRIIKFSRSLGFSGATVFLGKGTIPHKNKWIDLLDITEIRKEIIFMLSDHNTIDKAIPEISDKFKLHKRNHGIGFRMPVYQIFGSVQFSNNHNYNKENDSMYNAIFIIVEKGLAEDVVEAATLAGSKGGTIINARGAGIHETSKVFNMEIEPEKEVVLILAESDKTEPITTAIRNKIDIDKPGKGMIFVQEVKETFGLFK